MTRPRRSVAVAVTIGVAFVAAACGSGGDESTAQTPLPDVDLVALDDGTATNLAELDGPAVINLWATWCAPCRREIPDFEVVNQNRSDEVTFVGINVGEDAAQAQAFVDEVGASYDQYLDPDGYAVTELNTSAMPVTIVIDADGYISTRHLGPMGQGDLNEAIDQAIS